VSDQGGPDWSAFETMAPPAGGPSANGTGANGTGADHSGASAPPRPPAGEPTAEELAERQRQREAEEARELARVTNQTRRRKAAEDAVNAEREAEQRAGRRLKLTPASAYRVKPVRWVWAGRMPLGEITLIPGREGAGKSTFLAWQAAAITRGELDGMFKGTPKSVLYAATEDSWEYTIAPRMIAAGADMGRVFRIEVEQVELTTPDGAQVLRPSKLSLPVDTALIPEAAREVDAAVLMCDPVISIIDDRINTFKAQELRSALEPLKAAVEKARIALAGLVHFNKSKDTDVLSMISGSRAWPEVARAVIAVAVDKDADEYTCVVSQVKNNLGRSDLPHLKYTIDNYVIRADESEVADEDVHIGKLRWTGESERGAEDILSTKSSETVGDQTVQVMAYVADRFAALGGQRVPLTDITERFPEVRDDAMRKLLSRCVSRGGLKRPARGFYEPGDELTRPCPSCGKPMKGVRNFCERCARELDAADRATGSDRDTLFD